MKLTEETLSEFESLLRKDYPDYDFTSEEIREIAARIIRLVELVYRPIPSEEMEEFRALNNIQSIGTEKTG